jgi:hypothetical protein
MTSQSSTFDAVAEALPEARGEFGVQQSEIRNAREFATTASPSKIRSFAGKARTHRL